MENELKQKLLDKNKKLIDMIVERVKRDFHDEIELIGLTGSFSKNDFHEKSDLDLVILNKTEKGWGLAESFIFDDVGYDIYCASWDNAAKITDMQILYYPKPEYLEKYNNLKEQTLQRFAEPIGINCIKRAKECIDRAKQEYANTMLSGNLCKVRYASGEFLGHIVHALADLNNSCIDKYGIKRFLEELLKYKYLPENFEKLYMSVIEAKNIDEKVIFFVLRALQKNRKFPDILQVFSKLYNMFRSCSDFFCLISKEFLNYIKKILTRRFFCDIIRRIYKSLKKG